MRILYFHQYFSTPKGAVGTRSYETARRLVDRGHSVTMVCGTGSREQTGLATPFVRGQRRGSVDGIDVIEFDLRYSNDDSLVTRSTKFARFAMRGMAVALREDYDLVFATTTPLTAGLPGIVARWMRRKPFVFEVRDLWPELPRAMKVVRNPVVLGAMSALEWASYRSADRLIGLAPGIVDGIARRGVARSRIAMIPNGCDVDLFTAESTSWTPPGVAPNDFVALFAGAHGIANGLDAVIDAAIELQRRGRTDIKIVLIGEGKLKARLQQRATEASLSNVVFHPSVRKTELVGLMAASHIGLQILANVPAFYDGTSPNKFFDYLAAGRPVLINYPGWLAEVVREHSLGYAVPPGDPASFADALEDAADHRGELHAKGMRAQALARQQFARPDLTERFATWLEATVVA